MIPLAIEIALKSGLVAGVALLLATYLKRLPAAQRAFIAHLGLGLALLMPLLVIFGPNIDIAAPWNQAEAADEAAMPAAMSASDVLLVLYGLVTAALLVNLVLGLIQLARLQRDAAVITDAHWLSTLAHAQQRLGVKQGVALLCSGQLASPVSWGLLRPTIMLHPAALRSPDQADAVIAHELAHIARMDWANLLLGRLATSALWFNPIVWLLARHAHELREAAADDVVLRGDAPAADYATLLVDFVCGGCSSRIAAHGVTPGKASLKRRVQHVLDRHAQRDPAHPLWIVLCAIGALAFAAPLGAVTPAGRTASVAATLESVHLSTDGARLIIDDADGARIRIDRARRTIEVEDARGVGWRARRIWRQPKPPDAPPE